MAARASMAELITRLRVLTGDTAVSPTFDDDALQAALDERRTDVVEAALRYRPSFDETATIFRDFFAPRRWWEDSAVLHDVAGAVLTPDTADLTAGHWTFTDGQAIPVFISGSFFDLYGTASGVLESWAAQNAREFDFATDGQRFDRSQKREGLLKVAAELARRAIPPGARPAWRSSDW